MPCSRALKNPDAGTSHAPRAVPVGPVRGPLPLPNASLDLVPWYTLELSVIRTWRCVK